MRSNPGKLQLHLSTRLASRISTRKGTISEVREITPGYLWTNGCWLIAKCRFSTRGFFDHYGKTKKQMVKNRFENWKKPVRPQRSVRKIDEYVIDYTCEDACLKGTNVKSVKKCSLGRSVVPTTVGESRPIFRSGRLSHTKWPDFRSWSGPGHMSHATRAGSRLFLLARKNLGMPKERVGKSSAEVPVDKPPCKIWPWRQPGWP